MLYDVFQHLQRCTKTGQHGRHCRTTSSPMKAMRRKNGGTHDVLSLDRGRDFPGGVLAKEQPSRLIVKSPSVKVPSEDLHEDKVGGRHEQIGHICFMADRIDGRSITLHLRCNYRAHIAAYTTLTESNYAYPKLNYIAPRTIGMTYSAHPAPQRARVACGSCCCYCILLRSALYLC